MTPQDRAQRFRELHQRDGAFLIPNPWDAGSARILESLGFEALATTSSGFAQTLGRLDGEVTLEEKLVHCAALVEATTIPINADFENGFADEPAAVAANLKRVAATGVSGASIEDFTGNEAAPIYDFDLATERVAAAAEASQSLDPPILLTARCENLLHGINDLDDTLRRLLAYQEAGADVLYAPGLRTLDQVRTLSSACERPLNVLAPFFPKATVDELAAAGAKRLSIGGALARATVRPILTAASEMLDDGTFGWVTGATPGSELAGLLAPQRERA